MTLSVIIIAFHSAGDIHACLQALVPGLPSGAEVVVVDNASDDPIGLLLARDWPAVRLLTHDVNLGFAGGANAGLRATTGEYVLIMNPDTRARADAVERLLTGFGAPEVAVTGPRLVNGDGITQPSARRFPTLWRDLCQLTGLASWGGWWDPDRPTRALRPIETDWVVGAFFLGRRSVLQEVGLFDTRFFLYSEEVDLCLRLKRHGYQVWYYPAAVVEHQGGSSSRWHPPHAVAAWRHRSRYLYYRKHHGPLYVGASLGFELGWHAVRWLGHSLSGRRSRAESACNSMATLRQAWIDTRGGRVSPPIPWSAA